MSKFTVALFLLLFLKDVRAQDHRGSIQWDTYGVPHIYGQDMTQMYYEFGWAQMHNHADLLLRLYGQARGRAAEYWGEKYLVSDKQVRLFEVPSLAEKEYAEQVPEFRHYLDAFAKGINDYAGRHPEAVSPVNKQVLPVTPEDVLAHGIRVIFLRFVAAQDLGMASRKLQAGSNALAIGPSRSATGHSLLLANPHLPWNDLFTFFEAHLQAPGMNAYGVAVVGLPVLNIAFNDHLGWTLTVNTIDACDRYELSVQGDSYWLDSVLVPFRKESQHLKVRQADGTLREQSVELAYSRHGPVLGIKAGKAYAIRIAGIDNPGIFLQWHRMAKAVSWQEFEGALQMMQLPMFNVIYADDHKHILYLFDGDVPRRPEKDWQFWSGAIDGRYSKYIWKETLPYKDLPALFDPPTGFVQNANDPPWTCTYPGLLDPHKYPDYLSPVGMELRPQRAVNMIRRDTLISLQTLAGYKLNTGMEAADRFLQDLLAAAGRSGDTLVQKAVAVLKAWDRSANADSRGAVLFTRWFDKMDPGMFSKGWNAAEPVTTPAGIRYADSAVYLLASAAREVMRDYDSLDVAWGDVYRFRMGRMDYPANGGPDKYGIYRTIYFIQDADKKYRAVAGDSYVAVTEFGKQTTALVLLSYGNATQPGNKHVGDQLPLLSRKEWRTAWRTKEDILKNVEETESF